MTEQLPEEDKRHENPSGLPPEKRPPQPIPTGPADVMVGEQGPEKWEAKP